MPYASSPINASPDSLSNMRLYLGVAIKNLAIQKCVHQESGGSHHRRDPTQNKLLLSGSCSLLRSHFGSKLINLLLDAFTNDVPRETLDLGVLLLQQLFDRLFAVFSLHENLTHQSHFPQELLNRTFHHLVNDICRLARVSSLFGRNTTLGFDQCSINARGVERLRLVGCNMHRQTLGQRFVATFQINQDTDLATTM